jgi:hypothetical protein
MKRKMERSLARKRPKSLIKMTRLKTKRRKTKKRVKKPKRCEEMCLISLL